MDPIPYDSLAALNLAFTPLPSDPEHLSREHALQAAKPILGGGFLPSSRVSMIYGLLYGITPFGGASPGSDRFVWLVLVRNLGRKQTTIGEVWGRCAAVDAVTGQEIAGFEVSAAHSPREVQSRAERLAEFAETTCGPILDALAHATEEWRTAVDEVRATAERVNDREIAAALRGEASGEAARPE
jgi:hypothetical protein